MAINNYSFEDYCEIIEDYALCMDDYPYVMDMKNDKYYISKRAVSRFNVPTHIFSDVMENHKKFVHEEDIEMLLEDLAEMTAGKKDDHDINYRWLDRNGKTIWINCRGKLLRDEVGQPSLMIGCVNEIGNDKIADNISGLLESTQLYDLLEEYAKENVQGYGLRIGIDSFKDINEKFGTEYGNFILKGVADCIREQLDENQQVYHVVADEYIVIDSNNGTVEQAQELYKRIRRSIDSLIEANNFEAVYTISGGIVMFSDVNVVSYPVIMKFTQFSLTEAKIKGKNQVYVYDNADYEKFLRKKKILEAMRASVEHNFEGFDLYFQPIVGSKKNGEKLYAAESLLRFTTREGEFLSPVEFIPILEDSGLIIPVGRWILDQAAKMCKLCLKKYPDFKISVNLSYVQIIKSALVNEIFNCIGRNGIKPENLIVEMTESGYLEDTMAVSRVWNNLRRFGVLIAIDDFGTGYSNLQSISRLTPNIVKIDRGFTIKALTKPFERQLMTHIIQLVHSIDLKICVEGVEEESELNEIWQMESDYIQGYYYSKPLPRAEFLAKYVG